MAVIIKDKDKFHIKEFLWILNTLQVIHYDEAWLILGWLYD